MNSQAKAVLWIGFFLIVVQIVHFWPQVKQTIFSPGPGSASGGGGLHFPWWWIPVDLPGFALLTTPGANKVK